MKVAGSRYRGPITEVDGDLATQWWLSEGDGVEMSWTGAPGLMATWHHSGGRVKVADRLARCRKRRLSPLVRAVQRPRDTMS